MNLLLPWRIRPRGEDVRGRELEVVPDKHEGVREAQRAKACRQRNLRRLVNNAVVEFAAEEQRAEKKIPPLAIILEHTHGILTDQSKDTSSQQQAAP